MISIRLSWPEVMIGASVGTMRKVHAMKAGLGSADGHNQGDWNSEIDGACGELAVAKWLGLYWSGTVGETKAPDVGPYEVRTNGSRKYTDTILRPRKVHGDRVYIAVLGFLPVFEIIGWIYARDGMQPQWFRNGSPDRPKAWFVPQTALLPLDMLPPDPKAIAA